MLPLERLQVLSDQSGMISVVLVSNGGDALSGATLTGPMTDQLRALLANPAQVLTAQIILRAPAGRAALHGLQQSVTLSADTKNKIIGLQTQVALPGQSTGYTPVIIAVLTAQLFVGRFFWRGLLIERFLGLEDG